MRRIRYFFHGRLFPCTLLFVLITAGGIALAVLLPRLLAPVALLERIVSFAAALGVVASKDLPERKIAKLVLLFLPWTGVLLLLWFRPLPQPVPKEKPTENRGHGTLISRAARLSERLSGLSLAQAGSATYFTVGREMYTRLLEDLGGAAERIWLEYYIIARGSFWGDVLSLLEQKAAAGLDVRVLYDDFGCAVTLPEDYAEQLARSGIRASVYRPMRVGRGFSQRDHRKLAVIDDVCYTGGINLADEYIGERVRFGHWKDTAVRIEGDVSPFAELFLRTWYALNPSDGIPPHRSGKGGAIPVVAIADGMRERTFPKLFALLVSCAREKLYLFTPYLSLPHESLEALRAAALSGVDVRLMIPRIPDKKPVFFLTRAYARALSGSGIRVREYVPGFLHAKSAVLDGTYSLVSSYNLDFRSFYVQEECGALIEDRDLAAALERDFLSVWEQGEPVKKANALVRLLGRICMLFAPLT